MNRDVRLRPFWKAIRKRLASPFMLDVLGKPGRIYVPGDPVPHAEANDGEPWTRIIVMPVSTLWPVVDEPGKARLVPFLVKAETADVTMAGYDINVPLDAAQAEVYNRLDAWMPGVVSDGPVSVHVVLPVYRYEPPSPAPLFDDSRRIWAVTSQWRSEFRAVVS